MFGSKDIQFEYFSRISTIIKKIQNYIEFMETSIELIRTDTPKQKFTCLILEREFSCQKPRKKFCTEMNSSGVYRDNRGFGDTPYKVFLGTRAGSLTIQNTLLVIIMLGLSFDEALYFAMLHNHNFFIPTDISEPQYFDFLKEICCVLPSLESSEKRFEYAEKIRKTKYKNIIRVN